MQMSDNIRLEDEFLRYPAVAERCILSECDGVFRNDVFEVYTEGHWFPSKKTRGKAIGRYPTMLGYCI